MLLLLYLLLLLQIFVFIYQKAVARVQLVYYCRFLGYLEMQLLKFLLMSKLNLIDDLEADYISVIHHQERINSSKLLILKTYHLLYLSNLLLVLLDNHDKPTGGGGEIVFEFDSGGLLSPQCIFNLIDDLIAALQLFDSVLMCQFFPTDLLPKKLYLSDIFLIVLLHSMNNIITNREDWIVQVEFIPQISINILKIMMPEDEYYMRRIRGGGRRGMYDYPPRRRVSKPKKRVDQERFVDPKDFSQVYENPLANLFPLLQYFTNLEVQKDKRPEDQRMNMRERQMRERQMRERRRHNQQSDEQYQRGPKVNPIISIISSSRKAMHSFQGYVKEIMTRFERDKQTMNTNRKNNLGYIQNNLNVELKGSKLLNQLEVQSKWARINQIIKKRLALIENNWQSNQFFILKTRQISEFAFQLSKAKQPISFKLLNQNQLIKFYHLIICFLTIPTSQTLHSQISHFSQSTNQIFKHLMEEQEKLRKIIFSLKYKQSSFYWSKILDCTRNISEVDDCSKLSSRRVDNFEAEYGGPINQQILKKLMDGQWLDNTITSTIIEYLKHIEGANNFHEDNNLKAFIFTHSETSIFINNQRDTENNYLSYEKLIFLVNDNNVHWFVITVYLNTGELVVYNSLSGREYQRYCDDIIARLKAQARRKRQDLDLKVEWLSTPAQTNGSDCGVFAIINLICAFDKQKKQSRRNKYSPGIIPEIRNSLFLFLLYLGYCKRSQVVPRKDYFDVLFRSTIHSDMRSKIVEQRK